MRKKALPFVILFLALMLDVSVLPMLVKSFWVPTFSLCSVVALGLLLGRTRGSLYGLLCGAIFDIMVGYPVGLRIFLYVLAGFISGVAGRRFQRYALTPVVTPVLCFTAYELAMPLYLYVATSQLTAAFFWQAALRVALQTVLVQFLYMLYERMLTPRWSRYASR